ncbi:NAD(P)-dependent oxidoreductase [Aquitalea magnusonii]|uniref:NAD(P)-dependent oxidoreductase n=1 Tax=Aquitalea magnusonii TaxID=332411 RepID=UPI0023BAE66D|nr:NAD(P)-dependent oxidoreductase [Aquitalea magnusonii]
MDQYQRQQQHRQWQPVAATTAGQTRIGVLGLGEIGGKVAQALAAMGYDVAGWSRQGRSCRVWLIILVSRACRPCWRAVTSWSICCRPRRKPVACWMASACGNCRGGRR